MAADNSVYNRVKNDVFSGKYSLMGLGFLVIAIGRAQKKAAIFRQPPFIASANHQSGSLNAIT